MKVRTFYDRQSEKTLKSLLAAHFIENYKLSPKAVETICNDVVLFNSILNRQSRDEGQVSYYATKIGESPAKSLKECEFVLVNLTLLHPDDIKSWHKKGLMELMLTIMVRIAREAHAQGGLLTLEDISTLLHISPRTAKRYKKILEERKEFLPLRGRYTDMGPNFSHKEQIISLFLLGYSETEIAERTHHSLSRVETYIRDFIRVSLMADEGYQTGAIIRVTKLSKATVLTYLNLYEDYKQDSLYEEPLKHVLEIHRLRRQLVAKKGGCL
jgi:hypothetical protein